MSPPRFPLIFWAFSLLSLAPSRLFAVCEPPAGPAPGLGIGVAIQIQMPNHLPDYETSLPAYGAVVGLPVGPGEIILQSAYGTDSGVSLSLTELGYRWNIPTPFFYFYLYGGAHYLFYAPDQGSHQFVGMQFGPGILFSFGDRMDIQIGLKGFFESQFMLAYTGVLSVRF